MKKNVFGLLALVGAFLFAACSNPMIASGSSEEETAPTPVVRVVAAPTSYVIGESSSLIATVSGNGKGKVSYQWYELKKNGEETSERAIEGAEEDVYVSKETTAGDYVYFVRVSNVLGNSIKTVDSDPVTITVKAKEEAKATEPFLVLSVDKTVYAKGVTFKLVATAESNDGGTLTYQWFKDDAKIEGASGSTYETSEDKAGTYKYKVVVTNSLNNTTASKSLEKEITIVDVEKVDAQTPVFETVLTGASYDVSDSEKAAVLSAKAKVTDGGLITYKWYLVEGEGENQTETELANGDSYEPSIKVVGKFVYKLVATNNNAGATGKTSAEASLSVVITVVDPEKTNAQDPVINNQPAGAEYTQFDENVQPLSVTVTKRDDGALTYQWYKNNKPISGETNPSYTPSVLEAGSASYYVVITNTIADGENVGIKSVSVSSDKVTVKVNPYKIAAPEFTQNNPSTKTAILNSTELLYLLVVASSSEGEPTYQWYEKKDDEDVLITGKTTALFYLSSKTVGTFKYFCRATVSVEKNGTTYTEYADSDVCTFTVTESEVIKDAEVPVISGEIADVSYKKDSTATAIDATATVTDGGVITYQWFKLTESGWASVTEDTATNAKYTPSTATVGDVTYKVVVKNTNNTVNGNKEAKTEKEVKVSVTAPAVAVKPEISSQPASAEYNLNATTVAALSVEASSSDNGTLSYQWYLENNPISGANEKTYTPASTVIGTAGVYHYKVVVTNTISNGSTAETASSIAVITVVDSSKRNAKTPSFTTDLSETVVEYTVSTTEVATALTVEASTEDSDGSITYEWYENGVKITGLSETEKTYTPDITAAGTFTYYVIAKNTIPAGENVGNTEATVTSKTATIKVNAAPVINAKAPVIKTDLTVEESYVQGDTVTLAVQAESEDNGTLSYQWFKGETKVGTDSASLVIDTKDWAEDGKTSVSADYHVIVKNTIADNNDGGKKSEVKSSKTVTVTVTPFVINEPVVLVTPTPNPANLKLGSSVTLSATVSGQTEGSELSYSWILNEHTIPGATESSYTYTPTEVTASGAPARIYCTVIATKINGTYTATKSKASGDVSVTVSDWSAQKPVFSSGPQGTTYDKNASNVTALTFTAAVTDGGTLSYQWYKADSADGNGTAIANETGTSYTPDVSEAGSVYYYVKVTNTVVNGSITKTASEDSSRALITVNSQYNYAAKPVITSQPVSKNYTQGDSVTELSVAASANTSGNAIGGNKTYQWFRNTTESNEGGTAISGATQATYTPSISEVGTVYYYCVVTNTVPEGTENLDPDTSKHSASTASNPAKIEVKALTARKPIATIDANKTDYTIGDSEQIVLTVVDVQYAPTDEGKVGTLTYQWYEVDGETLSAITGATASTYTVPSNVSVGSHSYTVKVTNTVGTNTAVTSDAATAQAITIIANTGSGGITIDFTN